MKPVSESIQIIMENLENSNTSQDSTEGLKTGFKYLDEMLGGLKKGEVIVIGARPAMGKTTLALQMAYQASAETKKSVAYFSNESLTEEITLSLLTISSKVDLKSIRKKKFKEGDFEKIASSSLELAELPIYINDTYALSTEEIASECNKLKQKDELSLVVIDYLQLIKGDKSLKREEQISNIMLDLKTMARELNCPVIVLSQLSRAIESRPNRRPSLQDFRESGIIEQIADVVLFIYRDEVYNRDTFEPGIAEIIVEKDRRNGLGTCKLYWKSDYCGFENI